MSEIIITPVDQGNLSSLQSFAESFEHRIEPCQWPLYEAHHGDKRLAYFHVVNHPIIYPSIHPHCTPREVYRVSQLVRSRIADMGNSPAVLVPQLTKTFSPRIMAHLGFKPTNLLLYVS